MMPVTGIQKLETLDANDAGVARLKFIHVVEHFLDHPNLVEIPSYVRDISNVVGFKGEGSKFWVNVQPSGGGFLNGKPEGETEVLLYFRSDCDIKAQIQWFVSITDPSGQVLVTSRVLSMVFHRQKGKYIKRGPAQTSENSDFDVRIMEDAKFGRRKDITGKRWLFDGSLHVVVDVLFKVLEGGIKEIEGDAQKSSPTHPLVDFAQKQIDFPDSSDFTLISADRLEIKTNKFLLMRSPVFRRMFKENQEEARSGICKIEFAKGDAIKAMLYFLIGLKKDEWSFDLIRELIKLADKYELRALSSRAALELSKILTTKNLIDVLLLAYHHSESALLNEAFNFLEDNFVEVTLDGVLERLASDDTPGDLVRQARAHWYLRQEGVEMQITD